jgi:xylan 1,4-beta-xylosidase
MMNQLPIIYLILLSVISFACQPSESDKTNDNNDDSERNTFTNPILAGDYPDPSLFREGDIYYMTHSSFEYYPGLLIWKSKDLVNWTPVTHALHEYVGSVWAPDLIKHGEKYYIYFPAAGSNWVVTADHPEGPWNPPVDLKVGHIDPGHVVAEDGTRYVHLSGGHAVQLTNDGLATAGEVEKVYQGWQFPEEWSVECFCLEAPKLTKRNDYYYLTSAEGGTAGPATSHMVVSARSENALGPWENSPFNPVVHTQSKEDRWWSTGHGTLVDDTQGNWWIMFHGYEKGYHTLGRQTLMQPIVWTENDWFKLPDDSEIAGEITLPPGDAIDNPLQRSDDFSGEKLGIQWQFFKDYDPERFQLISESIVLKARGNTPVDSPPLLVNPGHHGYEIITEVKIDAGSKAGLVLFYNENAFAGVAMDGQRQYVYRSDRGEIKQIENELGNRFYLKLVNDQHEVNTFVSSDGENWQKSPLSMEVSGLHHNVFGEFLSLRAGIFAAGEGEVEFYNFEYNPL